MKETTTIKGRDYNYKITWFNDCNTKEPLGRIEYVFTDGTSSTMSTEPVNQARLSWHRICRTCRARRAGRAYHHIINGCMEKHKKHGIVKIH